MANIGHIINPELYIGYTGKKLKDLKILSDDILKIKEDLETIKEHINNVGTRVLNHKKTYCVNGATNTIVDVYLPKGTWIVFGMWQHAGYDLSTYSSFGNLDYGANISIYDNNGWVAGSLVGYSLSGNTTAQLNIWPRSKDVEIEGWIQAIRIK